jgi:hypothetical protein
MMVVVLVKYQKFIVDLYVRCLQRLIIFALNVSLMLVRVYIVFSEFKFYLVPTDLHVKAKATLTGALFLIVSLNFV